MKPIDYTTQGEKTNEKRKRKENFGNASGLEKGSMVIIIIFLARNFLVGIGLVCVSLLPVSAQSINPNLWQTHLNKEFGFRISYPNDWKVVPSKGPNVRISVSPASGPGNCNVVAKPMADLKGFSQQQLNQEIDAMPIDDASWSEYLGFPPSQFTMIERRRARIINVSAIYGLFEVRFQTLEGFNFGKKAVATAFTPGVAWTITCGVTTYTQREGRQRYDELQPFLKKIMGSFTFIAR